jgi:hypothetical protein
MITQCSLFTFPLCACSVQCACQAVLHAMCLHRRCARTRWASGSLRRSGASTWPHTCSLLAHCGGQRARALMVNAHWASLIEDTMN